MIWKQQSFKCSKYYTRLMVEHILLWRSNILPNIVTIWLEKFTHVLYSTDISPLNKRLFQSLHNSINKKRRFSKSRLELGFFLRKIKICKRMELWSCQKDAEQNKQYVQLMSRIIYFYLIKRTKFFPTLCNWVYMCVIICAQMLMSCSPVHYILL